MAVFTFLLNLVRELAQVSLFAGMPTADHWRAILVVPILGVGLATLTVAPTAAAARALVCPPPP